jgi:hypothetical protein
MPYWSALNCHWQAAEHGVKVAATASPAHRAGAAARGGTAAGRDEVAGGDQDHEAGYWGGFKYDDDDDDDEEAESWEEAVEDLSSPWDMRPARGQGSLFPQPPPHPTGPPRSQPRLYRTQPPRAPGPLFSRPHG